MDISQLIPSELMTDTPSNTIDERRRAEMRAEAYNACIGSLDAQDGWKCDLCANKGYVSKAVQHGAYWYDELYPCRCQNARRAIRRLEKSGMRDVVKKYTLDSFVVTEQWQRKVKKVAQDFCTNIDDSPWMFIGGQSGSGKTHLCTACAVKAIKAGFDTRYMLWRDDVARLKSLVTDSERYESEMHELKNVKALYIDDLFKVGKSGNDAAPTAADINIAFEIINSRYTQNDKLTIISSERTISDLMQIDEAIAGRIAEKAAACGCFINLSKDTKKNYRMRGIINA